MARRESSSLVTEIIHFVSIFPWWLGLMLGGVSYGVLHHYATKPVPKAASPTKVVDVLVGSVWVNVATLAQYLVPALCVIGAILALQRRLSPKQQLSKVGGSSSSESLFQMSWQQFEVLVGEFFLRRGYTVQRTGGNGPDGGVDLVACQDKDRYYIQCKQWKAYKVGVQTVRELYGVITAHGAAGGFVVTAGKFTEEARRFAEGLSVELIDGAELHAQVCETVAPSTPKTKRPRQAPAQAPRPPVPTEPLPDAPGCPKCGRVMVPRSAEHVDRAPTEFWGCSRFPSCRGIRPIG